MRDCLIILVIFSLWAAVPPLRAQIDYNDTDWGVHPMDYSRVGTSGWQFLKLPASARTAAIGGITSALSHGDATACFTNPASIADVKSWDLAFTHMNYVADIKFQSFSVGEIAISTFLVRYNFPKFADRS